jgi:HK97 family phage major capsid protein
MKLHELQEARAKAVADMRAINDKAETETRDYSPDEDKQHRELKTRVADLDRQIERARDIAEAERAAPAILHHGVGDDHYEERARDFSICRAIAARIEPGSVDDGLERELSLEVRRRTGRSFNGIPCPSEVFLERRTVTVGVGAAAGEPLYPTVHRPDQYIDRLRSALLVERLGATVLSNLQGDQEIPRMTGSVVGQWIAEEEALTLTDPTFDDITLSPRTVGAMTSFSRRTLINAQPSIEAILRNDLAAVIARAIDFQALFGDGTNDTPVGVANATGVHELSLAGPTWPQVLDFVATIQSSDADVSPMGWVMSPGAVALFRATLRETGDAGSGYLMTEPGSLAGYPVLVSTAVPSGGSPAAGTALFGAWSQMLVAYWDGVDITANPFESAAYARGRVLLRIMRDVDVSVRHGESFAIATDLSV